MSDDGIMKILDSLSAYQAALEDSFRQLDSKFLRKESWDIYHDIINKDLNNLGGLIREVKTTVKELEKENVTQNLTVNTLSTRLGMIMGIVGGVGGLSALILKLTDIL